jgi:hypothetical protein
MEEQCRNYYWKERINFVANNIKVNDFTRLEPSASGGSLVVVMINTTVTL